MEKVYYSLKDYYNAAKELDRCIREYGFEDERTIAAAFKVEEIENS